jgi:Holliday junction resolvase RusA-like endonuclease
MEIIFSAVGNPRGKQRPRMARRGHKTITYTPQETLAYERTIRESFLLSALKEDLPLKGLLVVDVVALFPRTKALSFQYKNGTYKHGRERIPHNVKPDADNVLKCVLDGIGDYIEGGDSRVVSARITKLYSGVDENSGTIVRIRQIELDDLAGILDVDWADSGID